MLLNWWHDEVRRRAGREICTRAICQNPKGKPGLPVPSCRCDNRLMILRALTALGVPLLLPSAMSTIFKVGSLGRRRSLEGSERGTRPLSQSSVVAPGFSFSFLALSLMMLIHWVILHCLIFLGGAFLLSAPDFRFLFHAATGNVALWVNG